MAAPHNRHGYEAGGACYKYTPVKGIIPLTKLVQVLEGEFLHKK